MIDSSEKHGIIQPKHFPRNVLMIIVLIITSVYIGLMIADYATCSWGVYMTLDVEPRKVILCVLDNKP